MIIKTVIVVIMITIMIIIIIVIIIMIRTAMAIRGRCPMSQLGPRGLGEPLITDNAVAPVAPISKLAGEAVEKQQHASNVEEATGGREAAAFVFLLLLLLLSYIIMPFRPSIININ